MPARPLFTVIAPRGRYDDAQTTFALVRDRWDDFGFKTQYALFRVADNLRFGDLKILKRGQTATATGILPDGPLEALDDNFCSLGQDLDYYERLASLPDEERTSILTALKDVVLDRSRADAFRDEEGWSTSLRRQLGSEAEFENVASVLLTRSYASLIDLNVHISYAGPNYENALEIDFETADADEDLFRLAGGRHNLHGLPRRLLVVVGRNGSGKSTLLARLARILHASGSERQRPALRALGTIEPSALGFTRIVAISYSAFDSFEVPGISRGERLQIAKDLRSGEGRYVFCGLRDIAKELENELGEDRAGIVADDGSVEGPERRNSTLLKPLSELAEEFVRTLQKVRDHNRSQLLSDVAETVLRDPSFNDNTPGTLESLIGDNSYEAFMSWSTGHKIVFHILTSLVAYAEPKSIILFDEPEAHLHPPLLAALMHGVRHVLEATNAFGICATHSPVVAQETLRRHVKVIRRDGDRTYISSPRVETYGENIGVITDELFGLNSNATDYHRVLEAVFRRLGSIEGVERTFDGGLSMQARAFLMTLAASRPRE